MIKDLADYYKSLDPKEQVPQKGLDNAIKQINRGLLDFAFGTKGGKLEEEKFIGK